VVVVKHPASLFGRATAAVADVSFVVGRDGLLGGAAEHGYDREADAGDGEGGAPAVVEDVEADVTVAVDVGVFGRG